MSTTEPHPRRIVPALSGTYDSLMPFSELLIRATIGLFLVPHGVQKLFGAFGGGGIAGTAQGFEGMGFSPGILWATLAGLIEFFGGLMLAVGLLTRPVAAAVTVFMAVAVFKVHWPNGFFAGNGGYEFALMWGLVALAFVIRGGGRYSVDAAIGREF
ncbi:MAG TPA: DoxX family protein [Alphaproteobacteria bacterium]|nr:DoxX family protein [Alphaproteobacteria bacterium]